MINLDSTLGVLFKEYPNFLNQFRDHNIDILETRLLLRKTVVMRGEAAAAVFYDQSKFKRKGATPKRFQKTLFGQKGVQGLDGQMHIDRKRMFMQCMGPESILQLDNIFKKNWHTAVKDWPIRDSIKLFTEVETVLCKSACEWVGVPLSPEEVEERTSQLSAMIDSSGAIGLRHYKGRLARKKAEKWIENLIKNRRNRKSNEEYIFSLFSEHQNSADNKLTTSVVAIEILNLLRPIVAISRYITFSALALHNYPHCVNKIKKDENYLSNFVQEVRRFYPFFPFVAAVAKDEFKWNNTNFTKGERVLLDLYATNHDEKIWQRPEDFNPDRFKNWDGSAYNLIPQGGGDHYVNHRCAGEWITISLIKSAVELLLDINYTVPEQDLSINMARIPAIPKSRFIINISKLAT
tara:strand:+ start:28870 stop:30090 length:1221 start_codon:yes stop_codon:yes gene_type:complete